ncbi:hypothetical protein MKX01_001760 [Papaver californicum]|nr:hypothetical protein MKX01_001760 [Papaver californicum]
MNRNSSRNVGNDDKQDSESKTTTTKEGEEADEIAVTDRVPFFKLFSFADSTDVILMVIGTISAIVNGWRMPIMAVLGGQLVNSFAITGDSKEVLKQVSEVFSPILFHFYG